MKKSATFLLILLFSLSLVKADNWELFPLNQKTYFYFETEEKKTIVPYYVDYERPELNKIRQFPLKTYIERSIGGCYDDMNLEGDDVDTGEVPYNYHFRKKGNRFEYVFSTVGIIDEISIYTHKKLGESWEIQSPAFTNRPYNRLKVTCTSIEFEELASGGIMDSVKTFEIEAFNGETAINAVIENFRIKISEQYGLVEWFNFEGWVFADPTVKITLAGFEMDNGEVVGERTPRVADFYPYSAGSVLKWKESYWLNGGEKVTIHTDTILSVEKTNHNISYFHNRYTVTEHLGEVTESIIPYKKLTLDFFPQSFIDLHYWDMGIITEETDKWKTYQTIDLEEIENNDNEIMYCLKIHHNADFQDDCTIYSYPDFLSYYRVFNTIAGLKEEWVIGGVMGLMDQRQLLEAFIAEEDFTSIEQTPSPNLNWSISPNPAQDYLTIELDDTSLQSAQLRIFDTRGEMIWQTILTEEKLEVNMSDFPKGIYFIQVSDGMNQWTEKVVKY